MSSRWNVWLVCMLLLATSCGPTGLSVEDEQAIRKVMADQEQCWNQGDLECFMAGYWHSDSLQFIGSKGLTYGWQQTLDNYKRSYPDRATMGKLTFDILNVKSLEKGLVLLIGKWHLSREEKEDLSGHYSLVWKKIDREWRIISDHSS